MNKHLRVDNDKTRVMKIILSLTGLVIYVLNIRGLPFELIDFLNIILFSVGFAAADYLEVSLPQGGTHSGAPAIIIASILLFKLPVALSVAFFGGIALAIIKKERILSFAAQAGEYMVAIVISAALFLAMGGRVGSIELMRDIVAITGLAFMFLLVDVLFEQILLMARGPVAILKDSIGAIQIIGPFYTALVPIATLMAMMHKNLNFWGVILFFPAIYIVWYSYKLLLDIKKTYRATLCALSSIIDVQENRAEGNSRKVAELAVGMAKMIGIRGDELEDINNAALLRDIGKVGLEDDPFEHRYTAKPKDDEGKGAHCEIGCEILSQVDSLKGSADMVKHHHSPFRLGDGSRVSAGAQVIHLAARYDDLVSGCFSEEKMSSREAVAAIKQEQGTTFDPKMIRVLINILRHKKSLWTQSLEDNGF
ncbi:MAG: HD domain-containing protein [Actinomycetota bacterium]|nr:HD domain-containing protein [Actinomycetota bacterium]